MKKVILSLVLTIALLSAYSFAQNRQSAFSKALRTCEKYSQTGSASNQGVNFNIQITLEKGKNSQCVYKEKIYQDNDYQMLTCNFTKSELDFMANSMEEFYSAYPQEFEKNRIFEAKLTTNGQIFNKYLANPSICKITYTKKKR